MLLAAAGSYLRSARDEPDGWARLPGVQPGPADEPAVRFVARAAREAAAAVRGQLSREIEAPRPPRHKEAATPSADEPPPDSSGETSPR